MSLVPASDERGDSCAGLLPMDADILPPTDDRIFKSILIPPEAKPFLMKLIAALIGCKVIDVIVHSNELPISDTQEKAQRFDVNAKIHDGSQINLEMVASRMEEDRGGEHKNLKGKSVYYMCDLHSSQPAKGQQRYDKLARSYQVTFCAYTIFRNRKEYINSFSMRHDTDNELLSDAIQDIFVELSKLGDVLKKPVDTMTDIEKFCVFFGYAADPAHRDIVNMVIESEEVLTVASKILMNISQDERERAIFRSRKKFLMDQESNIATAVDNAIFERNIEIALKMLSDKESTEKIVRYTGLTREEIENLRAAS